MSKPLSPTESLALVSEHNEQIQDKKYHRSRNNRKDTRPEYAGSKECNHVSGQFYDKLFKSKQFRPKLEPNAVPLPMLITPQSSPEQIMCDRLGLSNYHFNYPRRAILSKETRQLVNLATNLMEEEEHYIHSVRHKNQIYPGTHKQQVELKVRWMEYLAMLNIPKGFNKKYPYIYNVLRDQFITKIIMYRNMKKMYHMQRLLMQMLLVQGQAFQQLYNLMSNIPNIDTYFKSNPDQLIKLKEIEQILEPLSLDPSDPNSKMRFKQLLNIPEYTRQVSAHYKIDNAHYIQECKKKYANRMLILPGDEHLLVEKNQE
jgi:hypothetical protein